MREYDIIVKYVNIVMLCAKMYDCQFIVYNSDVLFDKNV